MGPSVSWEPTWCLRPQPISTAWPRLAIPSVTVTPLNDPPVAVNDTATTPEDTSVSIPVLANDSDVDGDPLTITTASGTNGTVSIVGTNLVFTPATNFNGVATLSYTISDGHGGTASATV